MHGNSWNWTGSEGEVFAKQVIAGAASPPEKRPLYRELPPPPVFPIDALGPLKDAAMAIHLCTQAPIAIAGQSVLAAATLAIQAQRDIVLPGGGQKPLTGLFISVAESGERKSSVDRLALAAVNDVEREWGRQAEGERIAYINEKAAWDFAREQAKKASKSDASTLRSLLDTIGPEPKVPPHPMLIISDPTPEALILHFVGGRPFAGVFTAEGGLLIGGAAFSDESKMRTAALLNTFWDGDPIRRKRVGTGDTYLPGRRCSAHVMLQPVIADELFGKALFDGIGLTARMLLVAPNSTAGTRFFREPPVEAAATLKIYGDRIRYLLTRPTVSHPIDPGALSPPAMTLDHAAKAEWIRFHDSCEAASQTNGPLYRIRAFAGKLAEHAGRLAALLTVYNNPDALEVQLVGMQCAVQLATHYASEMLRLADGASIPYALRKAQRLLTWWQGHPETAMYLTRIYQYGPSDVRNAKAARAAISILEEHGWITQITPGTIIDGTARKEAWRIVP